MNPFLCGQTSFCRIYVKRKTEHVHQYIPIYNICFALLVFIQSNTMTKCGLPVSKWTHKISVNTVSQKHFFMTETRRVWYEVGHTHLMALSATLYASSAS